MINDQSPLSRDLIMISPVISEVNQNGGRQRHRCVFEGRGYLGGRQRGKQTKSTKTKNLRIMLFVNQILKVSPRSGGEVLDLNPKPVDTFYPSPRKAARATR